MLTKIDRRGPDDCWPWTGACNNKGYGVVRIGGVLKLAHRVVMDEPNGVVMHSCDNPPCCNPAHLSIGSLSDNTQDAIRKGRWNPRTKLTRTQVAEARERRSRGETHRNIGLSLGVARTTISDILAGRTWV